MFLDPFAGRAQCRTAALAAGPRERAPQTSVEQGFRSPMCHSNTYNISFVTVLHAHAIWLAHLSLSDSNLLTITTLPTNFEREADTLV